MWPSSCGSLDNVDVRFCPCGRVMKGECPTKECIPCKGKALDASQPAKTPSSKPEFVMWPDECGPISKIDLRFCPCGRVYSGKHGNCPTKECEKCPVDGTAHVPMSGAAKLQQDVYKLEHNAMEDAFDHSWTLGILRYQVLVCKC